MLPGFAQGRLSAAKGILVGAGGIGSEIAEGLVRKGIGAVRILDHDDVEVSNLNRQFFF
jgi:adenylyltransferase/sulfurtransferase